MKSSDCSTTLSLSCSLVLLVLLHVASGFHNNPVHTHRTNQDIVGQSLPLLINSLGSTSSGPFTSKTVLFNLLFGGIEEDPLETDRRQSNRRLIERTTSPYTRNVDEDKSGPAGKTQKRYVRPISEDNKDSSSSRKSETKQPEPQLNKPRLVRPSTSQSSSSTSSSGSNRVNTSTNSNERKARTTESAPGINIQLQDPKERVLVRHATASSAYSVDDFKGKKKKIIKPWSAGRKKNIRKQSNTGGLGRDGYGEELEVEVKNRPKKKRLVVAGSQGSNSKDSSSAAVNLLGGGEKVLESEYDEDEDERSSNTVVSEDARDSANIAKQQVNSIDDDEKRTVRYEQPQPPQDPTIESSSSNNSGNRSDDNERKATTSTTAGVNMQLQDPKERVLVRHATASSAYSVDDFKGKKKKIIKPWSAGRKKNIRKQSNTGGLGRDGYGEDLEVEVKNRPEKKRLVMARTSSSGGNQDAAKALISGGAKENTGGTPPPTSADAKEEWGNEMDDDEYEDDDQNLVRPAPPGKTVVGTMDEGEREPTLIRHTPTKFKGTEGGEPSLVRHVPIEHTNSEDEEEPSLVRHTADREDVVEDDKREGEGEEEQRLVRAISASPSESSSHGQPKLVRANIMEAKVEKPKLVRPNIVSKIVEEPKLVRANIVREIVEEPKLVRANVQKEKAPERNLVRPKIENGKIDPPKNLVKPDRMGQKQDTSVRRRLVQPPLSKTSMDDVPVADLMYGAKSASVSPTAVPLKVKPKNLVKPTFATGSASTTVTEVKPKNRTMSPPSTSATDNNQDSFMYGSAGSSGSSSIGLSPTSVPIKTEPKKFVKFESNANTMMDNLMYGSKRATASPTSVTYEPKLKKFVNPSTETAAKTSSSTGEKKSSELHPDGDGRKESETHRLVRASPSIMNVKVAPKESRYVKSSASTMESDAKTKKKYVEPTTSAMDNAPDYDICQPAIATSNPSVLNVDMPVPVSRKEIKRNDGELEKKNDSKTKKTYVQPTASVMDNAPDYDICQPAIATSNPSVVNVEMPVPVSMKEIKRNDGVLEQKNDSDEVNVKDTKIKKTYVQPTASVMDNAPDWDLCQPAIATSNPAVVNVEMPVPASRKEIKRNDGDLKKKNDSDEVDVKDTKTKKTYVQPTASVMDNAPNWDSTDSTVQPAIATSNPSVVNVGVSKREEEKHLVRAPSFITKTAKDDANGSPTIASGSTSKERKEEGSMFAMTPAAAETMRQQVQSKRKVAFARSASADTPFEYKQLQSIPTETNPANAKPIRDEETKTKLPAAIAHAAGSSKSLSDGWAPTAHFPTDEDSKVSTDNQDSDTINNDIRKGKTQAGAMKSPDDPDALPRPTGVIPLTISSSAKEKSQLFRAEHALEPVNDDDDDEQHNKIDEIPEKDDDIVGSGSSGTPDSPALRKTGSSTNSMLGPDQQPLPNPSGVISFPDVRPLTTTAPADTARSKIGQHSRPNHPIEDDDVTQKKSLSSESSNTESKEQDDTSKTSSSSKDMSNKKKKLYLYDGGNPQPKEPWDFAVKGLDTKLDENLLRQTPSTTKKKLVPYDGSQSIGGTTADSYEQSIHLSSDVLPLGKEIGSSQKEGKDGPKTMKEEDEGNRFRQQSTNDGRRRFKEKTVSPFTRTVSDNNDENEDGNNNGRYNDDDGDDDSIDTVSKDVSID